MKMFKKMDGDKKPKAAAKPAVKVRSYNMKTGLKNK
jgi:hypothetical protein